MAAAINRNGDRMSGAAKRNKESENGIKVEDLQIMLDCAITEGARLRLPMFVWLLRLARLELMSSTEGKFTPTEGAPVNDG